MHIVRKNRPGQPYAITGELDEGEIAVLKRHRKGDPRPEISERLSRQAGAIIRRIKEQSAWIACDCLGATHTSPPILTPRKTPADKYTLQREGGRTEHSANCPFRWEEGELTGHQERTPGNTASRHHDMPDFILYKRTEAIAPVPTGKSTPSRANAKHDSDRLDPLERRLHCLIEAADLNRQTGPIEPLKDQLAAIRSEAENIPLFPGKDYTLSDILWTNIDWLYKGWARHHLLKMEKEAWPSGVPLQGYLLLYADAIEGKVIHTPHGVLTVKGEIKTLSSHGKTSTAPYAVLLSLRLAQKKDRLDIQKGYAHPVIRHSLMPVGVESDAERDTAGVLAWVQDKALGEGKRIVIEKPLRDLVVNERGETCRPDFLVRDGDRVLVVVTVTDAKQDNGERNALLGQLGEVVVDERTAQEQGRAGSKLAGKVFGWLRGR